MSDNFDDNGYKRLRIKTTFFLANQNTIGAKIKIFFKSMEQTSFEYRNMDIKIDALPLQ